MLTVKGLTIRFPESTTLALASAAFILCGRAGVMKNKRKSQRLFSAWRKHVDALERADSEARRAAIETLRSRPEARAEALRAIELVYRNEDPIPCCIVQAFHSGGPFIEPVCLNHPEQRFP
jgi:hypothetical protein